MHLDEIRVDATHLACSKLQDLRTEALILGIRRANGETLHNLDRATILQAGDILLVLGSGQHR